MRRQKEHFYKRMGGFLWVNSLLAVSILTSHARATGYGDFERKLSDSYSRYYDESKKGEVPSPNRKNEIFSESNREFKKQVETSIKNNLQQSGVKLEQGKTPEQLGFKETHSQGHNSPLPSSPSEIIPETGNRAKAPAKAERSSPSDSEPEVAVDAPQGPSHLVFPGKKKK